MMLMAWLAFKMKTLLWYELECIGPFGLQGFCFKVDPVNCLAPNPCQPHVADVNWLLGN